MVVRFTQIRRPPSISRRAGWRRETAGSSPAATNGSDHSPFSPGTTDGAPHRSYAMTEGRSVWRLIYLALHRIGFESAKFAPMKGPNHGGSMIRAPLIVSADLAPVSVVLPSLRIGFGPRPQLGQNKQASALALLSH